MYTRSQIGSDDCSTKKNWKLKVSKVILHGTRRNDDFYRNTAVQHSRSIVSNGCNIVPTFEPCVAPRENYHSLLVALNIVVANRPV